jgi:F-type H+-transporting ATPase subunit epsilon
VYTKDFTVEIVTPIEKKFEGTVQQLTLPGLMGEMTILGGHSPLLTMLSVGVTEVGQGSERIRWSTGEGFATIAENKVVCLVDFALDIKELDFAAIGAELQTVKAALANSPGDAALRVKKTLLEGKMKAQNYGK